MLANLALFFVFWGWWSLWWHHKFGHQRSKRKKKGKKNHCFYYLTGVVSHPTKVGIWTRTWLHMDENVEHESLGQWMCLEEESIWVHKLGQAGVTNYITYRNVETIPKKKKSFRRKNCEGNWRILFAILIIIFCQLCMAKKKIVLYN